MSDDELVTFANTGEVLPKPVTPLTYDMIIRPLERSIASLVSADSDGYDKNIVITHHRCAIALYNVSLCLFSSVSYSECEETSRRIT